MIINCMSIFYKRCEICLCELDYVSGCRKDENFTVCIELDIGSYLNGFEIKDLFYGLECY